jgi:hypothetical protein
VLNLDELSAAIAALILEELPFVLLATHAPHQRETRKKSGALIKELLFSKSLRLNVMNTRELRVSTLTARARGRSVLYSC